MNVSLRNFSGSISYFSQQALPILSPLMAKIFFVVGAIFTATAAIYAIFKCKKGKPTSGYSVIDDRNENSDSNTGSNTLKINKQTTVDGTDAIKTGSENQVLTIKKTIKLDPIKSIPFIAVQKEHIFSPTPTGYEWVKGDQNTKKFMETEKDLSIIKAVAKSSSTVDSPFTTENKLLIRKLFEYATLDQVEPIVQAVADDKNYLSRLFRTCFYKMEQNPSSIDIWKQKAQKVLSLISLAQLMNILTIDEDDNYASQENRICHMGCEEFLKWQHEINVPQEFINGCTQVLEYKKFVVVEAEKYYLTVVSDPIPTF